MHKLLSFVLFLMMAFSMCAQTDYSEYLNKAMEKLEAGDCAAAQRFYNVYKELAERSVSSIEALIADCMNELHIGDVMDVNGERYIIAYLMDNKQHGFAIKDIGVQSLNYCFNDYIKEHQIPTWEELDIIYKNNQYIGLTGQYWSRTESEEYRFTGEAAGLYCVFLVKDFISDKTIHTDCRSKSGVLLLYRF